MKLSRRSQLFATTFLICTILWYTQLERTTLRLPPTIKFGIIREHVPGNMSTSPFYSCILPTYSPWDPERMKYHEPDVDPFLNCVRKNANLTELVEGRLIQARDNVTCWGRCVNRKTDIKNELGPVKYTSEDHVFECDIVAAYCSEKDKPEDLVYTALHSQIVENKSSIRARKPAHKQYNVYIIMMDSTANTQIERNMPKTMNYLRDSMGAVTFPNLNKVASNSRPNGFSILFGKRLEPQDRTVFHQANLTEEGDSDQLCYRFIDNETSIFDDFRAAGYRTAMIEDYGRGILNYPACMGWQHQRLDHTMKPLSLIRTTYSLKDPLRIWTGRSNCIGDVTYELDYLGKYFNSYPDQPKFGFMWDVGVGHDFMYGSVHFDKHMHAFLQKHRERLDDSFVFFFGDHGPRVGQVYHTPIGRLEGNNPFLTISVPAELRNNSELMGTLRENSQKLQTHWDTRATLLDILKFQPLSNFTDRSYTRIEGERGSSYLRKMPEPRTCATLQIPFEFCICQFPKETLDSASEFSVAMGQAVLDEVNRQLSEGGVAWKCAKWKLKEVEWIHAFVPSYQTRTYHIQVNTAPNIGVFQAFVLLNPDGSFHVWAIDRKDTFWDRGKCTNYKLENKCDCEHFLFNFFALRTIRSWEMYFS